jgi:predicted MPP superfamily phosphohydrolase
LIGEGVTGVKEKKLNRRQFLRLGLLAVPAAAGIDAHFSEPGWLRIKHFDLNPNSNCRLVHFSDLHYKGDAEYGARVVGAINQLEPDFVCFTGDLVEEARFAPGALDLIRQIKRPVYGCPGNWDYLSGSNFRDYEQAFRATGGEWLEDKGVVLPKHELQLIGLGMRGEHVPPPPQAARRLLLIHYPMRADRLDNRYDLILAGHSHGGQVRIPFFGALVLPYGVGRYELGYYESSGGPLYVNGGLGTHLIPVRFNCRPELTLVRL